MLIEERHQNILELLERNKSIRAREIEEIFGVGFDTARRDLRILEEKGKLKRTHGGALPLSQVGSTTPKDYTPRDIVNIKDHYLNIGLKAVSMIQEHDVVFIQGGSIGYFMTKHLSKDIEFTVVTNSIILADELRAYGNINTYVIGGRLTAKGQLRDHFAEKMIREMRFDIAFITAAKYSPTFGMSIQSSNSVSIYRALIENARKTVGLFPHEKIGLDSILKACEPYELDTIITDDETCLSDIDNIRKLGVEVITVEKRIEMNQAAVEIKPQYLSIRGGKKLKGSVSPDGAKNSALIQLAALALVDNCSVALKNVPNITDVYDTIEMLKEIGLKVRYENDLVEASGSISSSKFSYTYGSKIRASLAFLGSVVAKRGQVVLPLPGGDKIGPRPIDIHIDVLKSFGVDTKVVDKFIHAKARIFPLKGTTVHLRYPSVLATVNGILLGVHAEGKTVLHNVAKEPEIVDLTNLLSKMGAVIRGVGTDRISIEGVKSLRNTSHEIMPDRLEAAALMMAIVMSGGEGIIENTIPEHNEPLIEILKSTGVNVTIKEDTIHVKCKDCVCGFQVETRPFPGFATDIQPILTPLALKCPGVSKITDTVHKERFSHASEMIKFGASIDKVDNSIYINGMKDLHGSFVEGGDIRSVVSLINTALFIKDQTTIYGLEHLNRGHRNFINKLNQLGADIEIE